MENSKKILITGGAGFIGSWLTKALMDLGSEVVVFDLKKSSPIIDGFTQKPVLIQGDLRNFNLLQKAVEDYDIELIFHLAAQPIVETAYLDPKETLENNIMGTVSVLESVRKTPKVKKVIITSSDKSYGRALELPYKENHPLRGDHPYDVSKSSGDLIANAYFKTYNLPIVISRFSNVFGPGDLNFSRVMPGIFEAIIKNKKFLTRSDGKMIRQYTYIEDIIRGYLKLMKESDNSLSGEVFNFGSQNIFSVDDVIKKIEKILNVKIDYETLNTAKNEIPEQYLNWSKVQKVLGWEPQVSFEEGIKKSFNWYRDSYFNL